MFKPGPRNLITDVTGIKVGNIEDHTLKSGVTVLVCDNPAVAGVQVLGGAPGTRETDLLEPHMLVEQINAIALSGGSAFGLDAASGVQAALREQGRGFAVAGHIVPIVPAAILFDLANGGDKNWGRYPPYRDMGYDATMAADEEFLIGSYGAGTGATTAGLKGGLGSASTVLPNGITLGALVAVNAAGSCTMGDSAHFWAAPFEIEEEFGGLGYPLSFPEDVTHIRRKPLVEANSNTTIAIIATDAQMSKADARRLAIAAHDGFARAIWPAHTPVDGDLVFGVATGTSGIKSDLAELMQLYAAAGATMARAITRGIYAATGAPGDVQKTWQERFRHRQAP